MIDLDITALQRLPEITIRHFCPDDVDHAYRIVREIGIDRLGKDLRAWDKAFLNLSSFVWVASVADVPIGFAGLSAPADSFAYLHTDLVSPRFQRCGVGTLLTLTRFAALAEDEIEAVGVLATEHSASFYRRFGFELESDPQLDPFAGYYIHRMSMPFSRDLGQAADALLDGLSRVTFDFGTDFDPLFEVEKSS